MDCLSEEHFVVTSVTSIRCWVGRAVSWHVMRCWHSTFDTGASICCNHYVTWFHSYDNTGVAVVLVNTANAARSLLKLWHLLLAVSPGLGKSQSWMDTARAYWMSTSVSYFTVVAKRVLLPSIASVAAVLLTTCVSDCSMRTLLVTSPLVFSIGSVTES